MANIPVERTQTGVPPWLWLVGLLLLALLIWFLFETFGDNEEAEIVEDPIEVVDEPVAALDLSDVYVTRVVGDKTFFVAPTEGGTDETLVYLEEEPTPNDATEGRYDVTPGQHLAIVGTMEPTPADVTPWGLTPEQADMVGDQYVRATSLTVLDGAMADDMMEDTDMEDTDMAADVSPLAGTLAAGQSIVLDGIRVTGVPGDSTFYVGDGAERTLVILEDLGESETGAGGTDGVFDINDGDVVDIDGTVRSYAREMRGTSDLPEADMASAETRRFVIVVDSRGELSKQ